MEDRRCCAMLALERSQASRRGAYFDVLYEGDGGDGGMGAVLIFLHAIVV